MSDVEYQTYHLQTETTTNPVEDLVANPFANWGTRREGSHKATPN